MVTILHENEWHGCTLQSVRITGTGGEDVPCTVLLPNVHTYPVPVVLATHGATSSKHEWTECDGYTKGGNLSLKILHAGIAVVAMDWHYHGDNATANMHGRNVFEEAWFDDFFKRSVADAKTVLQYIENNELFATGRVGFSGYSLAGTFGFWLANHGVPFKTMVLCVPGVNRSCSRYYSSFNNLDNVTTPAILQVSAESDEYIPFEEATWLFNQIPSKTKKFISYNSGHSLPVEYVDVAEAWVKEYLKA